MNDIVQFVVKMKDLASGGVIKLASTARSSFAKIDNSIVTTQRKLSSTRPSIDALNRKLDDLRKTRNLSINTSQVRSANREIERLENRIERSENLGRRRKGSSSGGGGLLGMVGGARGLIAGAGIAAAVGGVGASLSAGMKGGANKVAFETMAGVEEGAKLYNDLNKFAQDSIFGTELLDNAKTMLAFGASARDVMPDLKMLGDISMGDKEKLGSLTLAFSQIRATGRLMGQDLLQLVNAGFNPLQIMSEKTGKSIGELKEDMEKGLISFDAVKKAFEAATGPGGRFFEMTNKIAETPFGKWEAFKGQLQGIALQFGTALLPAAAKVIDVMTQAASYLPPIIASMQPFFSWLSSLNLGAAFTDVFTGVQQIGAAILPIFIALKPLVETVIKVFVDVSKKAREFIAHLLNAASPALVNIARVVSNILSPALRIASWLFGKILDVVGWVIDKLMFLIKPITWLFEKVSEIVGWMMDKVADTVDSKMPAVVDKIKNGVSREEVAIFLKNVGKLHGEAYTQGMIERMKKVAIYMDSLYRTNAFTNKYAELFGGAELPGVTITAKRITPRAVPAGISPTSSSSSKSDNITGSGVRSIVFNIDTLGVKGGLTINAQNVSEGAANIRDIVVEQLNRALDSVGGAVAY